MYNTFIILDYYFDIAYIYKNNFYEFYAFLSLRPI